MTELNGHQCNITSFLEQSQFSSKYLYCNQGGRLKSCLKEVACRRRDRWQQESGSGDVHRSRDSRFYILYSRDRGEGGSKQPGHATSHRG